MPGHDVRGDRLALLVRQALEQRQRQAGDLLVGGRRVLGDLGAAVRHQALLQPVLGRRAAPVVGEPPRRDRVEPRPRRRATRSKAPARDQGGRERLAGEVAREHAIARAPREERLHGAGVARVEGPERVRVGGAQEVVVVAGVFDHASYLGLGPKV